MHRAGTAGAVADVLVDTDVIVDHLSRPRPRPTSLPTTGLASIEGQPQVRPRSDANLEG